MRRTARLQGRGGCGEDGPVSRVAPFSSLRVRLAALVLATLLPAAGIVVWADRSQRGPLLAAVRYQAHDLARLVAERHETAVARTRGLLVGVANQPSLRGRDGPTCSAALARILKDDPVYSNVAGVDRDGAMFCSAAPLRGGVNLADRRHVRVPLERGEFAVGGYVRPRSTPGLHVFAFGAPVHDDARNVVAVAIAAFDLARLQRDLDALALPEGAEVVVVDASGVVLTGRPAPGARVGTPLDARLLAPTTAHVEPRELDGLDGVRRIYAFHDILAGGEVAMRVAAGLPTATAYAPLRRITRGSIVAFLAVAAVVLLLAVVTGELLLVRKLEAVAAAARRLASGDPTARTGLAPSGGELGVLVEAFDEMAASLQRLAGQNRLILDAVGEGIVGMGEDGAVTFANPAAARALGWTAEEMLGRDAHALFHPRRGDGSPLPAHECRIQAAMRDEVTQQGGDVLWRRDGASVAVEFVSTPLLDQGRRAGAVVVFRDVSERRKLEDRLRHAEKMEAVGQLAGGVAHDFNNLLTAIVSYAALVREALGPRHPSDADVREIEAAATRAAALTRQLLAFSRRQRVAPQVVELHRLVAGMERILRRVLPENVRLDVVAHAPGTVFADPAQLEVVILNLAVNARDALPRGGTISVRVFETEEGHDAGDGEVPAGPLAVLEVSDDGTGMDDATRARIFEPFFTTKPAGKGTGLGLATVYGIVSQAGGEVRVRSAPGRGSEFRVCLPRWSGAVPDGAAAALAHPVRGHETVLVVEDDAAIRFLVQRALSRAGYHVALAATADEALEAATSAPDLLLSDVILPGANGWELACELQRRFPALRVLLTSGYAAQQSGEPLVPGEAHFLAKPFAPDELLRKVREVLDAAPQPLAAAPKRSA
jgi:PAS domain S-box-containing protein